MESLRVLRVELYRLVRSRAAWLGALFLAGVPALRVLAAVVAERTERARQLAAGRELASDGDTGTAWGPFVDGWRTGLVLAGLLLLIHSARAIAADRESWVLRLATTRRTPRHALVVGRALLALLLVAGAALVTGASAWLAARAGFDFGALSEDGYVFFTAEELRAELAPSVLAALPPLYATWCFGLLLSALIGSASAAVGVALALYFSFDLFKDVLGGAQRWIFASYAPSLIDGSAMKEMAGIARGLSDAGYPQELLARSLWLPLPQAALLLALAALVVARRPL